MITLGLTGSIGMGKSTTSVFFARQGAAVHDADAAVHRLYRAGGAGVAAVAARFPAALSQGSIDRTVLASLVQGDAAALAALEAIVHPLVRAEQAAARARCRAEGRRVLVLDIPLLLETGGDRHVDAVIVVTAPADLQRARVLARPGMNEARLAAILARQMPDAEKRRRAHFVVETNGGMLAAERAVADILRAVAPMAAGLAPLRRV